MHAKGRVAPAQTACLPDVMKGGNAFTLVFLSHRGSISTNSFAFIRAND
jgi:hypothetical protein